MRLSALAPVLCCTVALILSFLCLFAGHKKGFMEDYHLVTLNTSMLGQTVLDESSSSTDSSNPLSSLLNEIPDAISSTINDAIGEVTAELGIADFYSAHMLDYCQGQYTPIETANATVKQSDISKNVTECSKTQAMYKFDPTAILEEALNKSGLSITLDDLDYPSDISDSIKTLNALMAAMFVLYCIAIALIFVTLLAAGAAILLSGRLSACVNFVLATLAFLAIALASALVTAVVIKAADIINDKGADIGLGASWGGKFLALTWAATGLMLVVVLTWVVEFCVGRRQSKHSKQPEFAKHG